MVVTISTSLASFGQSEDREGGESGQEHGNAERADDDSHRERLAGTGFRFVAETVTSTIISDAERMRLVPVPMTSSSLHRQQYCVLNTASQCAQAYTASLTTVGFDFGSTSIRGCSTAR